MTLGTAGNTRFEWKRSCPWDQGAPVEPFAWPAPALARRADGLGAALDVRVEAARQPADARLLDQRGDRLHGLEIARRGDGEAGLNDVHIEPLQLPRHLKLFLQPHARAGALFAVAQRRIENHHAVLSLFRFHRSIFLL